MPLSGFHFSGQQNRVSIGGAAACFVKGKKNVRLGDKNMYLSEVNALVVSGGGEGLRCAGFEAALPFMCFAAVLAKSATTVLRRAGV